MSTNTTVRSRRGKSSAKAREVTLARKRQRQIKYAVTELNVTVARP